MYDYIEIVSAIEESARAKALEQIGEFNTMLNIAVDSVLHFCDSRKINHNGKEPNTSWTHHILELSAYDERLDRALESWLLSEFEKIECLEEAISRLNRLV